MNQTIALLLPVHIMADIVWVGALLCVALLLVRGPGDAAARGSAGALLYRTLAVPAMLASLATGGVQLALGAHYYLRETHFMHAKLLLVVIVLALHHVLGARARKMAAGALTTPGPASIAGQVIAVWAFGAVLLVATKPF